MAAAVLGWTEIVTGVGGRQILIDDQSAIPSNCSSPLSTRLDWRVARRRTGPDRPPVRPLPVDVRVGAYGVIVADDRILLTHWNELGRTGWTLPGGGMEEYETPQQAAVREIREETGFDTEILDILGVDSMYLTPADRMVAGDGPLHALRIVFRARIIGGSLTHEIGGSSDEARWVPLADVAALPTVSLVGIALRFRAERG